MKPDVILLDIGLPDMSGWSVLEAIRGEVGESGTMPIVVVITAYGDAANRLVGQYQNVNSYLVKPFTSDELLRTVRQAISGAVG
jgi:CheY-like chemotaxis protein